MRPNRPVVVDDEGVSGNPRGTAPCVGGTVGVVDRSNSASLDSSLPQLDDHPLLAHAATRRQPQALRGFRPPGVACGVESDNP